VLYLRQHTRPHVHGYSSRHKHKYLSYTLLTDTTNVLLPMPAYAQSFDQNNYPQRGFRTTQE
jgi:hypothetical protein